MGLDGQVLREVVTHPAGGQSQVVLQGSVFGQVPFIIFIDNLDEESSAPSFCRCYQIGQKCQSPEG